MNRHFLVLFALALSIAACDDVSTGSKGAGVGGPCATVANCRAPLACVANTCVEDGDADPDSFVHADFTPADGITTTSDSTTSGSDSTTTGDQALVDFEACEDVVVTFSKVRPTVILLVDQSGSMVENFQGIDRWDAVYQALMAPGAVVEALQDEVSFGLALYTSNQGYSGGTCPIITSVPPKLNNYSDIDAVFAPAGPRGDTPTGESIDAILPLFTSADRIIGPRLILLATDGEPDTCAEPNIQNGQPQSIAAVERAYDVGVELFILSVGSDVGAAHLQDMANAGQGIQAGEPDAPYTVANNPAELTAAINEVIYGARTCVFTVEGGALDVSTASIAEVRINGDLLSYGGGDGWIFHSGPQSCFGAAQCIELVGAACTRVLSDDTAALRALFPCPS